MAWLARSEEYEEVLPDRAVAQEEDDDDGEEVLWTGRDEARGEAEEEEEGDDDESDDEQADRDMQLLQEACLPVSGAPLPPSAGPPQNADEYLRQVQWERLHCPEVVEADNVRERAPRGGPRGGSYLARFGAAAAQPDAGEAISREWAEDAAAAFQALRAQCEARRRQVPPERTQRLTFVQWRARCTRRPRSAFLAKQTYISLGRLAAVAIEAFVEALQAAEGSTEEGLEPLLLPGDVDLGRLDRLAEWVFAALAFVELPLMDDMQFQMQRLRRCCLRLLDAARRAEAQPGSVRDEVLSRTALLIVVITEVFGQR